MPYRDRARQSQYQNERMQALRRAWLAQHGPCVRCGRAEELEVHHRDRTTKVTHRVWSWSRVRREAELAKCEVLCRQCHREETTAQLAKPIVHGTDDGYKNHGCRCAACRAAHTMWKREYNARRQQRDNTPQ